MRKILIITPHYPPSNLAAVHRSRLFAMHLPEFNWEPIILTVDEQYYEEKLDWNLHKLLPANQRIEKASAYSITKPRLVGDIGLRGFFQLRKRALELVRKESIDFVYIPIPSFYVSLLGPYLNRKTGVKYGIDYIDPWVHVFPGSDKKFSRHWWSTRLANWLEPKAVKNASLITGVAEGYYKGVLDRNPYLKESCLFGAMPYGGEKSDHAKLSNLNLQPYLFKQKKDVIQLVYAGAMLPKAYEPLEKILQSMSEEEAGFDGLELHFIGTGKSPNDPHSYNIRSLAEKYNLWQTRIFEYPQRIPYLDVLVHLNAANGIFILGSTEPHYTPSKVFQAILSQRPVMAVLHKDSTALKIINETGAGLAYPLDPQNLMQLKKEFSSLYNQFKSWRINFDPNQVKQDIFESYSAVSVTRNLAALLDQVMDKKQDR